MKTKEFENLKSPEYYKTHPFPAEEKEGGSIYGLYEDYVEWYKNNKI